ncbi:His-Xaa-Ser system radical SAM maturase HxsB [Novosphingobium sp. TCA1]|uniref:His-Xaa-Ser system radical SAM maturase HxsB n=1 Tax=Novosphingobium sp. TCA1 TaxID=2682474 RepID=UPI001309E2FB|nr:His-Xaa-Ser system radical SAM maturase HxsB [Novosphingobium sp. TCA1]GFE77313.1 His-Xaa-Ser system radical SAM maturase HxsB [Novosphingobium sp. TCA1]
MAKFREQAQFDSSAQSAYTMLPWRFTSLGGEDYVATNMAGEYVTMSASEVSDFAGGALRSDQPIYDELKSRHFLIDDDTQIAIDLLGLKIRTKLAPLANFTGLHIFVTTLRCEHSCPYCQVSRANDDKREFDMSEETALRSLDLAFRSPSPAIKIEFQGGESTLNMPIIRFIVAEALRRNETARRNLAFVIATNLAVLDDEILQFARAHDILISTSLDGPADLHNRNRPRPGKNSYEKAVEGIARARTALGHYNVGALMTTTAASLPQVRAIIDEYIRMDFGGIFLRPLSPYGFAIKTKSYASYDQKKWLEFFFEGLDYIIQLNLGGFEFIEHYSAMVLKKMLTPLQTSYVDLMSPAGIGIGAVVYNYDGVVYASDESRMLAEMGDTTFALGNVHDDDFAAIFLGDALLEPLEQSFAASVPGCSWCAFEPWCGAEPVFHHATQGDFVGKKPLSSFCTRNMALFRGLISRMEANPEVRRIFERWANIV